MSLTNCKIFCRENWSLDPNQCQIFFELMQRDIKSNANKTSKKISVFLVIGKAKFRFFAQGSIETTNKKSITLTSKDFDDTRSLREKIIKILSSEYLDKYITFINMISNKIITNSISVHKFIINNQKLNHECFFCDFPKYWCTEIDRALFTPFKPGWIIREYQFDSFVLQLDVQSYADKTNILDYCFMAIGRNTHFFETHQGTQEIATNVLQNAKQITDFKTKILNALNPESTPLIGVLDMISRRIFLSSSVRMQVKFFDLVAINQPSSWDKAINAIFDSIYFEEE